MIHLENIEKSFPLAGGRSWVLRNIRLDIADGEFVSVMGPSGAGKSSLLNMLGLMDHDWQGSYALDGVVVEKLNPKQRQALQRDKIGFIFQHYHLIDDLKVWENLDLPLQYRDVLRRNARRRSPTCSIASRSSARRICIRASSPAASSSSSQWRVPSSPSRDFCSPTSRPARCIRARRARSWTCSANCTRRHDHRAGHPQRGLRRRSAAHRAPADGWIEKAGR